MHDGSHGIALCTGSRTDTRGVVVGAAAGVVVVVVVIVRLWREGRRRTKTGWSRLQIGGSGGGHAWQRNPTTK